MTAIFNIHIFHYTTHFIKKYRCMIPIFDIHITLQRIS